MKTQLFYHGDIITMEEENENPEAIFIRNGIIEKVGTLTEVEQSVEKETQLIDLQGKTLMPGFIDSHSHIVAFAQTLGLVDLSTCKSIKEIIDKLKYRKESQKIENGKWIIGFGYDPYLLKEKRHPTNLELDEVSSQNPILISHVSGHMGVTNSYGLQQMQIHQDTQDISGGYYGRDENGRLNGYLEENAFIQNAKVANQISDDEMVKLLQQAQKIYLENGITTLQEGLTKPKEWKILKKAAEQEKLLVDTVCYIDISEIEEILPKKQETQDKKKEVEKYLKKYHHHLKIGGYKIILDGSPQGKTAWISSPYENEKEYKGYPAKSNDEVEKAILLALKNKMQLLAHCNGDEATNQLITLLEKFPKQEVQAIRPVVIHAQIIREEQLKKLKELNAIPSFFNTHTYYWGDIHIQNLGWERAKEISPAKTAKDLQLNFTFHQDTPVLPPNMLENVWCAVNRITKDEKILGEKEKIDVYTALKAITINSAYQYFEENQKGSFKEGKLANMVLLDHNPLKVNQREIKNITVLKTFIKGEEV